jgi:hypothetical protein
MKQGMLERSIPVLIATNLPKIKPDSARRETGTGVGTAIARTIGSTITG